MDSLCNTQHWNETLHQIHLFYCNNSSCIQLPEVIKVKQALKSLVSWLAATLEENYQNFEKFLHLTTFCNVRFGFFLVSMLLQIQQNFCLRLQYILYLQYNKQWYQIARQIYCQIFFLLELQLFELLIAFLIPIFLILYLSVFLN